jgi:hypothetical protein
VTFSLLLIAGVFVLGLSLRSFSPPLLRRAGGLTILAASYLCGWLLTGSRAAGALCSLSWLLLPWLQILTQIRQVSLPIQRQLRRRTSPGHSVFPPLEEISDQIEEAGFEHLEDCGWDEGEDSQLFRIYYRSEDRTQAALCLVEQNGFLFSYLSLSSRATDGRVWTTWNYPFSYSLKIAPRWKVNLARKVGHNFAPLHSLHQAFLESNGISIRDLQEIAPEEVQSLLQTDMESQIRHNLESGLLQSAGEGEVRYSWRGMFFLWLQTLRDMVRAS